MKNRKKVEIWNMRKHDMTKIKSGRKFFSTELSKNEGVMSRTRGRKKEKQINQLQREETAEKQTEKDCKKKDDKNFFIYSNVSSRKKKKQK